jgi:hypothetical protein
MIAATINADTLFSSANIVFGTDAVTSEYRIDLDNIAESNLTSFSMNSFGLSSADSDVVVEPVDTEHWSAEKGQRFKYLAENESLGELSIEELGELESLTRLRRFEKYPRTADEILWHRRQQKVTSGLVQALQMYVDFHEIPHNA